MASSLAAFYKKTPLGHIEAGLRTGNLYSPWPEKLTEKLQICYLNSSLFQLLNQKNLLLENIKDIKIFMLLEYSN